MNKRLVFLATLICCFAQVVGNAQIPATEQPRRLVPGVLTVIEDVSIDDDTSTGPRPFTELIAVVDPQPWNPNFDPQSQTLLEKAQHAIFQKEVWALEFGFKPLRVIRVDGRDVWYLVYFVRNTGNAREPSLQPNGEISIRDTQRPVRFLPTFVLQSQKLGKAVYDRVLPEAARLIAAKERVPGPLHDSRSIAAEPIPVSGPSSDGRVWGVATWDNVDPQTDFISIYVQGLTNALKWQPSEDGYQGPAVREQDQVRLKTLQLNFWRPGDDVNLNDREILYGIPLYPDRPDEQQDVLQIYNLNKPIKHRWVYR